MHEVIAHCVHLEQQLLTDSGGSLRVTFRVSCAFAPGEVVAEQTNEVLLEGTSWKMQLLERWKVCTLLLPLDLDILKVPLQDLWSRVAFLIHST